jgi:excinuclease ABC subunit C
LEAELIKKFQPHYNIKQKDDKTSTYLIITNEPFPRLLISRPTALHAFSIKKSYGPFYSKNELEQALKILRSIFPYHSDKSFKHPCFHYQIGLCPGPCAGKISRADYQKNIHRLILILEGKRDLVRKRLEKKMKALAKEEKFEQAITLRYTVFALKNLKDIFLSQKGAVSFKTVQGIPDRLEAYDISNLAGDFAVGSMVVFSYGKKDLAEYRRFKIRKKQTPDDPAMLREVLERRFHHSWPKPNLIFMDGGLIQLRAAQQVIKKDKLRIPVVSAAKGPSRKGFRIFKSQKNIPINKELLIEASAEAHRFAIAYHRQLRNKKWLKLK